MIDNHANDKKILVLIMGGTINSDHKQTKSILFRGERATQIKPYRDSKGRLPVEIFIDDMCAPYIKSQIGYNPFKVIEIADCDSKDLKEKHYKEMLDHLKATQNSEYTKVLLFCGTDLATEIGTYIENAGVATYPLVLVTAMQEMTKDMNRFGLFNPAREWKTDGIKNLLDAICAKLDNGVHLRAHDGQYYSPSQLIKDFHSRCFVPKV